MLYRHTAIMILNLYLSNTIDLLHLFGGPDLFRPNMSALLKLIKRYFGPSFNVDEICTDPDFIQLLHTLLHLDVMCYIISYYGTQQATCPWVQKPHGQGQNL